MIFSWLEATLTDRIHRKSNKRKKFKQKFGTEYKVQKVMKCCAVKLRKSQRKTNYTRQNENSLDSRGRSEGTSKY